MKVFIATPVSHNVTPSFASSILKAGLDCQSRDIEVHMNFLRNSCFIEIARSVLVKLFLESDCTHFFFIDADIGFESHALAGLVQSECQFTAGVYRKREPDLKFNVKFSDPVEYNGPWMRAERAATGFMCIHRHVLEKMSETALVIDVAKHGNVPMVFHTSFEGGKFTGEDYCFCDDYNEQFDEGIWVYPDITFDHDGYLGNLHESASG
jgi:hypothetical protein